MRKGVRKDERTRFEMVFAFVEGSNNETYYQHFIIFLKIAAITIK